MTSPTDDRHVKALELHLAGATYETIAEQLGYASKASAHKIVQDALDALTLPAMSSDHKSTAMARLDAMLVGIWPKARRGDVAAIDRVLKIEERRLALLAIESSRGAEEVSVADDLARKREDRLAGTDDHASTARRGQSRRRGRVHPAS
jgi:hypothetical protein